MQNPEGAHLDYGGLEVAPTRNESTNANQYPQIPTLQEVGARNGARFMISTLVTGCPVTGYPLSLKIADTDPVSEVKYFFNVPSRDILPL